MKLPVPGSDLSRYSLHLNSFQHAGHSLHNMLLRSRALGPDLETIHVDCDASVLRCLPRSRGIGHLHSRRASAFMFCHAGTARGGQEAIHLFRLPARRQAAQWLVASGLNRSGQHRRYCDHGLPGLSRIVRFRPCHRSLELLCGVCRLITLLPLKENDYSHMMIIDSVFYHSKIT